MRKTTAILPAIALICSLVPAGEKRELTKEEKSEARLAITGALEAAHRLADRQTRLGVLLSASRLYEILGDRKEMLALLDGLSREAREPVPASDMRDVEESFNSHVISVLVRHYAESGSFDRAEKELNSITSESGRDWAAGDLVFALCRADKTADALRLADTIQQTDFRDRTLSGVISYALGQKRIDLATLVLSKIQTPPIKAEAQASIAGFLRTQGDHSMADSMVRDSLELAKQPLSRDGPIQWSGGGHPMYCPPSRNDSGTETLERIAKEQASADDISGALTTIEQVSDLGVREGLLVSIVNAQVARGRLSDATSLSKKIRGAGCRSVALGSIAAGHAKLGKWDAAMELVSQMVPVDARASTLLWLAQTQAEKGNLASAAPLARQILKLTKDIGDPARRADLYVGVGRLSLSTGDTAAARDALGKASAAYFDFKEEERKNPAVSSWSSTPLEIVRLLTMTGGVSEALSVARRLSENQRHDAFTVISCEQALAGDIEGPRAWLQDAPDAERSFALLGVAKGILGRVQDGAAPRPWCAW